MGGDASHAVPVDHYEETHQHDHDEDLTLKYNKIKESILRDYSKSKDN